MVGSYTIIVKAAPRFATILCRWFGRLAMPMGDAADSPAGAAAGAGATVLDLDMSEGCLERLKCNRERADNEALLLKTWAKGGSAANWRFRGSRSCWQKRSRQARTPEHLSAKRPQKSMGLVADPASRVSPVRSFFSSHVNCNFRRSQPFCASLEHGRLIA